MYENKYNHMNSMCSCAPAVSMLRQVSEFQNEHEHVSVTSEHQSQLNYPGTST